MNKPYVMKTRNIIRVIFLVVFLAGFTNVNAKKDKDMNEWKYELETVSTAVQGNATLKVWTYARSEKAAAEQAKKEAVHGVIFRGTPDNGRIRGQRALTQDPNLEVEQQAFFSDFFKEGGKYMKFVTLVNDGSISPKDKIRVGSQMKIGVTVQVNVMSLRKDLEDAGVIRSLGSGF